MKLQEAERRLQQQQASGSSAASDRSSSSAAATPPRQASPNKEADFYFDHHHYNQYKDSDDVKDILARLLKEEDLLRRRVVGDQATLATSASNLGHQQRMGDKELMIQLQQRKIAALDEANNRLVSELSRLGERGSSGLPASHHRKKRSNVQETPKTVDELLDSFNDTPV